MFFVGQKVTCVNDRTWPTPRQFGSYTPTLPVRGRIYTVRAIVPTRRDGHDEDGLHLVEIINPERMLKAPGRARRFELAFRMSRFRPVCTTSIDVFLRMLEPQDRSADAAYRFVFREPRELVDAE